MLKLTINFFSFCGQRYLYIVQSIELLAGAVNLTLMGMNIRDGLKMAGKLRPKQLQQTS
ncbi:hypothetical protein H0A36_00255 [Endozoicomonas sp. SM1973]|uniref:Uncharacterized protein n=1 Tax=Spartinivicinus marinus TaxID=2994442 RepID=A0A853I4A2_9GAMM|nr:hypothetical protein [Spartinivicinus marinus]MCX4026580.1 hypothetical protein [Spartinivicinus marinus]NYZ64417.1 hypothetical protein [Spartinivicinus marinus]